MNLTIIDIFLLAINILIILLLISYILRKRAKIYSDNKILKFSLSFDDKLLKASTFILRLERTYREVTKRY